MNREPLRIYHQKRRALAKKLGICCECNADKAVEGRTKCQPCLDINVLAQRERRAA